MIEGKGWKLHFENSLVCNICALDDSTDEDKSDNLKKKHNKLRAKLQSWEHNALSRILSSTEENDTANIAWMHLRQPESEFTSEVAMQPMGTIPLQIADYHLQHFHTHKPLGNVISSFMFLSLKKHNNVMAAVKSKDIAKLAQLNQGFTLLVSKVLHTLFALDLPHEEILFLVRENKSTNNIFASVVFPGIVLWHQEFAPPASQIPNVDYHPHITKIVDSYFPASLKE